MLDDLSATLLTRSSTQELVMPEALTIQTNARIPWNRGRIIGPKPPLKPKHIWALRTRLQIANRTRDLALFNLAIDSKLRGCDLVRLRVSDVYLGDAVRLRTTVCQQKTGRPVPFEITEPAREALTAWLTSRNLRAGDWLFPSRSRRGEHLTTRHYSRLVDRWVALIGLDPSAFGTHSLHRTKVALVYKRTGNIRACQLLLGHTKLESTVRYLGIEVDDALILSEQTEI
jgi:integrase